MEYTPKILKNESDKEVEFRCGGVVYIVKPGEKKLFDGYVAQHALDRAKVGLRDVTSGEIDGVSESPTATVTPLGVVGEDKSKIDFRQLSWKELVGTVKGKGYKVGMNREQIYALLEGV